MIKAQHSKWIEKLMDFYLYVNYRIHFSRMEIVGDFTDKGLPLLVIANHISWWDGFWIRSLNQKLFHRRFHVMMLEEQLRENLILRKLGAFSINPGSRSVIQSLIYASELLQNSRNLLLYFPQGEISSQHLHRFHFKKGIERIATGKSLQILMVANITDYFSASRPELRQYIFSPELPLKITSQLLEDEYNRFFSDCINKQKQTA
jgi:1-acyl-sn-glycerol-3-phosphate acyltransferase